MATYTIELDPRTAAILKKIMATTGCDESAVIKQGLMELDKTLEQPTVTNPYEVYSQLDLGEGGYALCPSDQSRQGMLDVLRRKHGR